MATPPMLHCKWPLMETLLNVHFSAEAIWYEATIGGPLVHCHEAKCIWHSKHVVHLASWHFCMLAFDHEKCANLYLAKIFLYTVWVGNFSVSFKFFIFHSDPEADQEASEMLTDNAQNLMQAVSEVLYATEAATIRVPEAEREQLGLQWVKRN